MAGVESSSLGAEPARDVVAMATAVKVFDETCSGGAGVGKRSRG
jgi:hypothetical protein